MTDEQIQARASALIQSWLARATPAQWHIFAARSNYDDNRPHLRWLVDNPQTDRATVLQIYWNLGAAWFVQFTHAEQTTDPKGFELLRLIERRYSAGYYANGRIWFDPAHSDGARPDAYPDVPVNVPIPACMFTPVNGEEYVDTAEDPEGYDEGLPGDLVEALYRLYA